MPVTRNAHRSLRLAILAALTLVLPGRTLAAADEKPAAVTTALPAVALAREQLDAIAAKGTAPAAAAQRPNATKLAHAPSPPAAMAAPEQASAAMAAKLVEIAKRTQTRTWPMISPSLGAIPRREWSDPFSIKHGDIAVIGTQRLLLPQAPSAPAVQAPR